MMKFVEVPRELESVFGEHAPGSRMYFKSGPQEEAGAWADAVFALVGPAVTRGAVSLYAPVGRAAVHKRLKEGRLTGFFYEITHRKRTLFGGSRDVRELDVALIPVSECQAWGQELTAIALVRGKVTQAELEGDIPDWHGEFLDWRVRESRRMARIGNKAKARSSPQKGTP